MPSTVPSANTVCAVYRYHLTYLSEMDYSTIFDIKMSQYTSNDNNIIDLCKAGWGKYYGNPENAKGYFGCAGRAESGDVIKIKYTLFYKNNDISITDRFVFTSNEYIYTTQTEPKATQIICHHLILLIYQIVHIYALQIV